MVGISLPRLSDRSLRSLQFSFRFVEDGILRPFDDPMLDQLGQMCGKMGGDLARFFIAPFSLEFSFDEIGHRQGKLLNELGIESVARFLQLRFRRPVALDEIPNGRSVGIVVERLDKLFRGDELVFNQRRQGMIVNQLIEIETARLEG